MTVNPSEQLICQRLQAILHPLLKRLETCLKAKKSKYPPICPDFPEEEARAAARCLLQLGWEEDGREVAKTWRLLRDWTVGPVMDEFLAEMAASKPEEAQRLRDLFGPFPSIEELAATVQERERRNQQFLVEVRRIADHLRRLLTAVVPPADGPKTGGTPVDDSAFLPASTFLDKTRFKTYKQLRAALEARSTIRTRKPSPQRLEIHAGDFLRYCKELDTADFEALDRTADRTTIHFLAELHRRQEDIKRRKA